MPTPDVDSGREPGRRRSEWLESLWPALLIGSVTLACAIAIGSIFREREARLLEDATATALEAVLGELDGRMLDQSRALERLAANWQRRGGLPRAEFEAEAGNLVRDLAYFQAIEWVAPSFRVSWVVPQQGNEEAEGLDLAVEPRRRAALETSRDKRETTVSRPIQLVQGGLGFIVYVPLDVDGRFDGFVVGVFRADDLFAGLLRNVAPGFGIRVADDGDLLYARGASDAEWPRARLARMSDFARPWSIEVAPRSIVVAAVLTKLPAFLIVAGATFALGFAYTAQLAASRRIRNRQLSAEVERREEAEHELSRVIESIPDHVWSGEITPEGFESIYYSSVLGQIIGRPDEIFDGSLEAWYDAVHETDVADLQSVHTELLAGQRDSFELEYRIHKPGGAIGWVRDRVHSSATKRGLRLDGVISDITATKRLEAERLDSETDRLLLLERERMTREMHDGLGGQLVSTIAMLERGRSSPSEIAESLRRALDDMRIAIDSLDPTMADLAISLGKLRVRLGPLLQRNGLALRWQADGVSGIVGFPPDQSLHILRIIQEAVTNALRHAKACEVSVEIRRVGEAPDDVLSIDIRDDGIGFRPDAARAGRGIRHMESRPE